jgi:putative ABC transport system permease protein
VNSIWQDLRYGLRGLRKQPGFTILAILALALGIGSATTIFSVIDNVLLDPFPYTDAQRIVIFQIHDVESGERGGRSGFSIPEFLDYKEQNHVFDGVVGDINEDVLYTNGEGTERFQGTNVTPNVFSFLGMPALLGRGITPDDGKPDAPPVFVMSYKLWLKEYNLDPKVLGRIFVLNSKPRTLVGIMPPRFTWWGSDLWVPAALDRSDPEAKRRYFAMHAHLKPGVTMRQAEADLDVIAHRLAQVYPKEYPKKFTIQVETLADSVVGRFKTVLYTLLAAVGLLLLIACANVANMLLARASAREKEMAIRASLGAGRWRLIRQMLLESLLLALGGAAAGCVLAYGGIKALVAAIPDRTIPDEAVIGLNVPVLLFSLAAAALTALLFGLAPAFHMAKPDIVEPLKDSGKGVSGGFRHGKLRNTLVVVEVALSLVLLVGAGLLMRSFVALQQVELGLNPDNILVARLPLPKEQYKTAAAKQHFFRELLQRLSALPGVVAATETSTLPPYGGIPSEVDVPGKTHADKWNAIFQLCSEGYFPTVGIRMLRGRPLSDADVNDARKVAVVNQTLVKKYFGQEDPIGRQIKLSMLETVPDPPVKNPVFEIIGVVTDVKNQGIQEPPNPEVWVPYTVTGAFERGILVRTAKDPMAMLNTVRREIWAVDRNVALTLTGSLKDYLKSFSYSEPRFTLILLGVFAGVGLVLVAIGVYSVIAYTVSRQTHEIGIRMALGAGHADVLRMVLRMGLRLIGLGVIAGAVASFGVTRLIASQIWGVSPHDPITLCGVVAVVAIAGLAACYFPARRATRVDPMVALRYE